MFVLSFFFCIRTFRENNIDLTTGIFKDSTADLSSSAQARLIREALAPPCLEPHVNQLSAKTHAPKDFCKFRKMIPTTFCFETMTVFKKFFK